MIEPKKVIIIGGGPAGLTAAYELTTKTKFLTYVFEKTEQWGGISKTINYKGNRIDIGGHRFFSKSDKVLNWWFNILPISKEGTLEQVKSDHLNLSNFENNEKTFLVRSRKSRIFYQRNFYDYPISLSFQTIKKLGFINAISIGVSYLRYVLFPIKNEKNLEDFLINRFGRKLYSIFFKDYTEKVWGVKCENISKEWGAQRIKGLNITKTILHFIQSKFRTYFSSQVDQKKMETSLIEYFYYPKFGPGQVWEEVERLSKKHGATTILESEVIKIKTEGNKILSVIVKNLKNGITEEFIADYFISTMPIKDLFNALDVKIPSNLMNIANGLMYRDFITVGLLLENIKIKGLNDNWLYIQEPDVMVGRIQIFNNWSPYMVENPNNIWIGLEYFCNEGDSLWNLSTEDMKSLAIEELIKMKMVEKKDVIDSVVIKMPKSYPAYFGTYEKFDELKKYLDNFDNLFLVGRNGMHKYNNQDHSMLTAMKAVELIEMNSKNKSEIWQINTEEEYHETKK